MREQKGQSLVEMAVIVPLLLILVIAIFEFGQAFATYIALVNSAYEGAIYVSLHPNVSVPNYACTPGDEDYESYLTAVKNEIIAAGLDAGSQTLTIDCPVAPQIELTDPITVTVHYKLTTFSSQISLPYFERLGRPSYYQLNYSVVLPIRNVP